MISLAYALVVFAVFAYFLVTPRRRYQQPPSSDSDDEGGEPHDDGLPDLDLPPGITRPVNDWEPDYNHPKTPIRPTEPALS